VDRQGPKAGAFHRGVAKRCVRRRWRRPNLARPAQRTAAGGSNGRWSRARPELSRRWLRLVPETEQAGETDPRGAVWVLVRNLAMRPFPPRVLALSAGPMAPVPALPPLPRSPSRFSSAATAPCWRRAANAVRVKRTTERLRFLAGAGGLRPPPAELALPPCQERLAPWRTALQCSAGERAGGGSRDSPGSSAACKGQAELVKASLRLTVTAALPLQALNPPRWGSLPRGSSCPRDPEARPLLPDADVRPPALRSAYQERPQSGPHHCLR